MKFMHVSGKKTKNIKLFALSTCVWCKKTKQLLDSLGVEYDYVFIDQLNDTQKEQILKQMQKHNPRRSFPTVLIDDSDCIVGYKEDRIREAVVE